MKNGLTGKATSPVTVNGYQNSYVVNGPVRYHFFVPNLIISLMDPISLHRKTRAIRK